MPKLIIFQGLPASGKTTKAKALCEQNPNLVRVNKDDIMADLVSMGWTWSHENEKQDVIPKRDELICSALLAGQDVVSDDINFGRHIGDLVELAEACSKGGPSSPNFVEVEIIRIDTPISECIQRDKEREKKGDRYVGEAVIRGMARSAGIEEPKVVFEKVEKVGSLMPAIICDLDGTLALFTHHRGPYEHAKCADDRVNVPILQILRYFQHNFHQIIYMSGRENKFRVESFEFLKKNKCPEGVLHMRETGDKRKDWIVKGELFDKHVRGKYDILFCLDDRDQVVKLWRDMGLTCLQVDYGAF